MCDNDYQSIVLEHINLFKNNKNPLNAKGDPLLLLFYVIDDSSVLQKFFDVLIENSSYKGSIKVSSKNFDDTIGYKIAKVIERNNLSTLIIENREKPFSDRVAKLIGDALEFNTNLVTLEVFLKVEELSPIHLCKFLQNPESNLENLYNLKLNKNLFESFTLYLTKNSKLKNLGFYYEPLQYVDLLYEPEIDKESYHKLADKIQNESHITSVEIIPLFDNFDREINEKLYDYIKELSETLKFSCNINRKDHSSSMNIEATYEEENNRMKNIMYYFFIFLERTSIYQI
jgi:hypothetical protein